MKKQILTLATLACFTLASVPLAMAKGDRHEEDPMRVFSKLDLSAQQKQEIRSIFKTTRENNSVYKGEKSSIRAQMKDLMDMPAWDEATARSILLSQIEQGKTIALNRAKARNQAYNLLTEEQKVSLSEKAEKKERGKKGHKAHKRGSGRKGEIGKKRLNKILELSDTQIAAMDAIDAQSKEKMENLKANSTSHRDQMRAITMAESFDEASWSAIFDNAKSNMLEHRLIKTKARYEKAALLSTVQKEKLAKVMEKMKKRAKHAFRD